jgi:hypothetical protein
MLKRYLIFIGMIVVLLSLISCLGHIEPKPSGRGISHIPPCIQFELEIVNNSSIELDCRFVPMSIGYKLIENSNDVFDPKELYLALQYMPVEEGDRINIDEVIDFTKNDLWNNHALVYRDIKIKDTIFSINKDEDEHPYKQTFSFDVYGRDVQCLNINLEFDSGENRVITGYPKEYYSKEGNVVYDGLFYRFDYDKRHNIKSPHYIDPETKEITPIPWYTLYAVKIIVNSPDDINVEILPETGEELPSYHILMAD